MLNHLKIFFNGLLIAAFIASAMLTIGVLIVGTSSLIVYSTEGNPIAIGIDILLAMLMIYVIGFLYST